MLARELTSEVDDLTNLRKHCTSGNVSHLDDFMNDLIKYVIAQCHVVYLMIICRDLHSLRTGCKAFSKRVNGSNKRERKFNWRSILFNLGLVKKRIGDIRKRVRDAQNEFLVCSIR